jgi:asparagine synthase (glutamine-hydrolysing)
MLPSLARRGPNAEGLHGWPGTVFGHRRLSILDLSSAGAQPMLSADGQTGVVFNGCIYNFQEIRRELEQCGHSFRSQCDTEVLIEGYREWGIDKLMPRLHGMFAFAIWDQPRRKLTLVRDRLGVKPLLYSAANGTLAFASTAGALQAGGFAGDIDPQSVFEFLDLGFVPEERCIFAGVRKLPPATILEWQAGRASERIYWTLPEFGSATRISFEEAVEETERRIVEAVRLRLVSDVPIAALLSGGIDSSLVCWALSKLNTDIRAFTVGTPGDPSDESEQAAAIARRLGIPHEIVHLDTAQPPPFDEMAEAWSEPFASASAMGMLRVSSAVKSKATVLLTGDGGDEVFLGYSFFYNAWNAQKLACVLPPGSPAVWAAFRGLFRRLPPLRRARSFLDYTMGGIGAYARVRPGIPFLQMHGVPGVRLENLQVGYRNVPSSFASAKQLLSDVFRLNRRLNFTAEFLPKVDGGTMYHSLEARGPLLDQKVWEFAAALPAGVQFHGQQMKSVLREIARRRVGPEVARGKKRGFTIPVERWLASKWSAPLRELKHESLLAREGWVHSPALARAVDESLAKGHIPQQLWGALVLEQWLRRQKAHVPQRASAAAAPLLL